MILKSINEIFEYIQSDKKIMKIVAPEHKTVPKNLMEAIKSKQIPFVRISESAFRIKYPQARGAVGIVEEVSVIEVEAMLDLLDPHIPARLLLLDEISDPQNIGAMLRTCVCFGFHGAILTNRNTAPLSEGVISSSAGACFHIPVARVNNLSKCIEILKKKDFWMVGTTLHSSDMINCIDAQRNIAVVMGNEQKGVRPKVLGCCDYQVRISMEPGFNSLNVSVAFGIVAYSLYQQR